MTDLLVEKYRPRQIDDVIIDDKTREKFRSYIDQKTIPHLLFHGTAGLGKTTVAKILAKQITEDCLYINASDDNNAETIRIRVKDFCYTLGFSNNIKIVILDEFDGMTDVAMRMLRNIMEEFSARCRFILTCNNVSKVIAPIRSRCQEFEFGTPAMVDIAKRCFKILKEESVQCDTDDCKTQIKKLVRAFYPDIRKTINNLQKYITNGIFDFSEEILVDAEKSTLLGYVKSGDIKLIRKEMLGQGCNYVNLYKILFDNVGELTTDNDKKRMMMLSISEHLYRHAVVPDHEINFVACILQVWTYA